MEVDPEYEYNAPQFVDFDLIRNGQDVSFGDGEPEDYFNFDHENGIPASLGEDTETRKSSSKSQSKEDESHEVSQVQNELNPSDSTKVDRNAPQKLSNICTSLEEWRNKTSNAPSTKRSMDTCSNVSKPTRLRRSNSVRATGTQLKPRIRTKSVEQKIFRKPPTSSKRTSGPTDKSNRRSTSSSRNSSMNTSASSTCSSTHNRSAEPVLHVKPKLTLPVTPKFMRKAKHRANIKTSEELEMERIKMFKQELKNKKQQAEESLKKAQSSVGYVPVKSSCQPTKPAVFHFSSDSRLRNKAEVKPAQTKDFVSGLRAHPSSPVRQRQERVTVPEPFHFANEGSRKRKHEDTDGAQNKFESMAETLAKFSTKTPERYRSKPNKDPTPTKKRFCSGDKPKLTQPKTPAFQTRSRTRTHHIVSQKEIEDQEVTEMQSHKFIANPVNFKVLKSDGKLGLKRPAPKEPTQFDPFNLETDTRGRARTSEQSSVEESANAFHARPVPRDLFEKTTGVRPAKSVPITVPESPAFALKARLRSHVKNLPLEPTVEECVIKEKKPVPHYGIPFQPRLKSQKTQPLPFSFETRDKDMFAKKEMKIKKILEDEKRAREFHANPIPDLSPTLPPKPPVHLTQPEPFELEAETRGAMKAQEWSQKIEEELLHQRELAKFKAKPCKVLTKDPFLPFKSQKPLTEVNKVELASERRAKERMEFEKWKKDQELEHEAERIALEKRQLELEEAERRRLRSQAVPRAQPIRHYKAVEIHPSDKPLTEAETPRFSQRLRKKSVRW